MRRKDGTRRSSSRRSCHQYEYDKKGMDPAGYLAMKRRQLISHLPADARLRDRVERHGRLLPVPTGPPDIAREAFTEEELRNIKSHHRSDPDCATTHLQRSQLVSMWNADNVSEDQWREYDEAEPIMRELKQYFGVPESSFHSDEVVGEKRTRIVSTGYQQPSRRRLWPETAAELEAEEDEELEESVGSIETSDELDARLLRVNAALRSWLPGSAPSDAPPSPPWSDKASDSGDDDEAAWALRTQALKEWVAESEGRSNESPRPSGSTSLDPALQGMSSSVKILEGQAEDEKYGQ